MEIRLVEAVVINAYRRTDTANLIGDFREHVTLLLKFLIPLHTTTASEHPGLMHCHHSSRHVVKNFAFQRQETFQLMKD